MGGRVVVAGENEVQELFMSGVAGAMGKMPTWSIQDLPECHSFLARWKKDSLLQ